MLRLLIQRLELVLGGVGAALCSCGTGFSACQGCPEVLHVFAPGRVAIVGRRRKGVCRFLFASLACPRFQVEPHKKKTGKKSRGNEREL